MTLLDASPATLAEIPAVVEAGCTSFKTYLTYAGFKLDDDAFIAALEAVGKAGGIALVHAENDAGIRYLQRNSWPRGTSSRAITPSPALRGRRQKPSNAHWRWPRSRSARCTSSTSPPSAARRR